MDKYKVLIIDDDEINRDILSEMLVVEGHETIQAENGKKALEVIQDDYIDLVLLDINMPLMNGVEYFKEHLRIKPEGIPTIIISSSEEQKKVVELLTLGAEDYFVKPFNIKLLLRRINLAIQNRRKESLYSQDIGIWANKVTNLSSAIYYVNDDKLLLSDDALDTLEMPPNSNINIQSLFKKFDTQDQSIFKDYFDYTLKTGSPWDTVLRFKGKKSSKDLRCIGRVTLSDSKPHKIEIILQDITEFLAREKQMSSMDKSIVAYNEIINQNNIVARISIHGNFSYVNGLFCEISGYNESDVIGKSYDILRSGYHPEEFFEDLWSKVIAGKSWKGQIKHVSKDGKMYWVDSYIKPLLNENDEIEEFLTVSKNITKEKEQLEADIKTAKLAGVGETTAQIVHDVMSPLMVIQSTSLFLKRALSDNSLSEETRKNIEVSKEKVEKGIKRINKIFHEMRALLVDDQKTKKLNLYDVVTESFGLLDVILDKHQMKFEIKGDQDLEIIGNKSQLMQVFINFIKNSIDANEEIDNPWIKVNINRSGADVQLDFIDSGNGIPIAVEKRIFESLYTTKTERGGTGLGLGICKKIIDSHGGTIKVDQTCENTKFIVIFK